MLNLFYEELLKKSAYDSHGNCWIYDPEGIISLKEGVYPKHGHHYHIGQEWVDSKIL